MEVRAVCELVERVAVACSATAVASREAVTAAVADLARVRSWADAQEVRLAGLLESVSSTPESDLAKASKSSGQRAARAVRRKRLLDDVPELGDSLAEGEVSGEHVDLLERELRRCEPAQRKALLAQAGELNDLARRLSPEEFVREVRRRARKAATDDGMAKLTWQSTQVRLTSSLDPVTGLTRWVLVTDPLEAAKLDRALRAQLEALFHDAVPEGCPSDPLAKQQFLRAHALLSLVFGERAGSGAGRPEVIVVVDTRDSGESGDAGPCVDWGLPVEIPPRVLADLFGRADVHAVIVRNGVILHAPGVLDLGRATRLANRAQRRALRGVYSVCAVPGCSARFDDCSVHHVIWWRRGGRTDLCNLLPLCWKHHQLVHKGGWELELAPDRTLTIRLPDGQVMRTGPPKRRAA